MKKSIITLTVIFLAITVSFAGTRTFNKEMKSNLETLRSYEQTTDYNKLAADFESIANKNKNRWEPLYYAAYTYIIGSWKIDSKEAKIEMLTNAKTDIDRALKLSPNNDEILVLDAFYYQAMIMVDPAKYGMAYSQKASQLLHHAQAVNSENPRAEFLLAQNVYYTPVEYGGGKDKALPLFSKAAKLFNDQDTSNFLNPVWGEETNMKMLKECSY